MTLKNSIKVLVIDNDDTFVAAVKDVLELEAEHYEVLTAVSGEKGMEILRKNRDIRVVLLDLRMPGLPGEEVLTTLKEDPHYRETPVVVITADKDVSKALEILEKGAAKFIVKPLTADELISAVKDVIAPPQTYERVGWTILLDPDRDVDRRVVPYNPEKGDTLQGRSDAMLSLSEEISRIAGLNSTVLILGETGVGKELVAKTLHERSKRRDKPFIIIDCSGLPSYELIYSELWGHQRGAFTGAVSNREGRVRQAEGGTVFLDEIGILDAKMQAQLLRFCDTKEFWPLGSEGEVHKVDARIIAATNVDLGKAVADGKFREDLYHRVSQNVIEVPPLRERRPKPTEALRSGEPSPISDDIEILVDYAIDRYNKSSARPLPVEGIELAALELLKAYDWPGNVRQLNNVINEAASKASARVSNRVITAEDVRNSRLFGIASMREPIREATLTDLYKSMLGGDQTDARLFADKVNEILNMAGANITKASELAQVSRTTMYKYVKEARGIYSKL